MNSAATKDNSVTTEFLCCDKASYIKPTQGITAVVTKKIMLQHNSQNLQPRATQSLSRHGLFLSRQTKHEGGEFPVGIRC